MSSIIKSQSIQSIFFFVLILLLISTQSCKQATEPRLEPELALTLEDVSCTEAWIQLQSPTASYTYAV